MLLAIVLVLLLFVVQTIVPPCFRYLSTPRGLAGRLKVALGPRDAPPEMPALGERSARALTNLQEALPVFLTLALLTLHFGESPTSEQGAWIFLAARALYLPAYLAGIPGVRSFIWMVSWVGLLMMLLGLPL